MKAETDFRQGMDFGRQVKGATDFNEIPHKYSVDEIVVVYGDTQLNELDEDAYDGWLKWVGDELVAEKAKQEQPLFRHKVFMLQGIQWADVDIKYKSSISKVSEDFPEKMREELGLEVGDEYPSVVIGIYTAMRSRNPTYTRKSFSAGDDMWDELGDLL